MGSGRADMTGVGTGASLPEKDITMAMIAMTPISAAPPPSRKARWLLGLPLLGGPFLPLDTGGSGGGGGCTGGTGTVIDCPERTASRASAIA